LGLQGIAWEDFISHDFFSTPLVVSEAEHEIGFLHIYLSTMRLPPCQCTSHTRRVVDLCLQQQSECYLHSGRKGPRFRHQHHRSRVEVRSQCMMRSLQESHQVNERPSLFSFTMMTPIQSQQMQSLERSSRNSSQRLRPCPLT